MRPICLTVQMAAPAAPLAEEPSPPPLPGEGRGPAPTPAWGPAFAGEQAHRSLTLRFRLWRNRLIGSPRFQAWASRNPFTRPIARREARQLFDLTAGFVYSQVAAALVESGLLDSLAGGPLTAEQASGRAGLPNEATLTLLKAAASLQLTEQLGGQWILGTCGAALAATPGLADMIRHHRLLYADLADPLATLRGEGPGQLPQLWRYDGSADPEAVATYSRLMAATQPMIAAQALAAYDFRRHRRLLDIGGGQGAFLSTIAPHAPQLELGLFDLPAVTARVAARPGLTLHPGSFLGDSLPTGYDLHSLVRVLHDHDDAPAARILAASRAALPAGGRILIVEPMAKAGGSPEGHAYFGLYLAAMHSGRPREPREIKQMLRTAGFARARLLPTPLPIVARCIVAEAK